MTSQREEIRIYLERAYPGAAIDKLAGDASTRIFYRIRPAGGETLILMDYGGPFAEQTEDMALTRIFEQAGLPVARILEASPEAGCLLMEDLGDRTLEALLFSSADPRAELQRAVLLAAEVAERGTPVLKRSERATGPALDEERFRFEMDFFIEHYLEGYLGLVNLRRELRSELHQLASLAAASQRKVLCHRDFHSRNLIARPDGALAMVDIQDARWGPESYDLASLLRDAYVEIDEAWIEPLIDTYLDALAKPPERAEFRRRFDIVAAQRMLKALGTFGYQSSVIGSSRYDEPLLRTAGRLESHLPRLRETSRLAILLSELSALG
jgi:aminoglycoside/choline kinase family phosphotransferase